MGVVRLVIRSFALLLTTFGLLFLVIKSAHPPIPFDTLVPGMGWGVGGGGGAGEWNCILCQLLWLVNE